MQRHGWGTPRMSPGRATPGTDPNDGRLVSKLLSKLKESQDLFDNLETLFDHKVKELGNTENDLKKAATHVSGLHRIIDKVDVAPTPARQLTSPPTIITSPVPMPASAVPMPTGSSSAIEVTILHERIRQMQTDHTNQMQMHTENINSQVNAKVQEEVMHRMAQHNAIIEQLKHDCTTQREEAFMKVSEQQADIERLREYSLRTEEENREVMLRREAALIEQVELKLSEEISVRDSQIQALKLEVDRARADIEERNTEVKRQEQSLSVANDTVGEMKGQHELTIEAIERLSAKHQVVVNECSNIQSQHEVAMESKLQLEREYETLQTHYDQQMSSARHAREDCERKKEAVEKLKTELTTLRRQVAEVQSVNDTKASMVSKLQIDFSTLQSKYDDQTSKHERAIKHQERQHQEQFEDGKNAFASERKSYESKLRDLQHTIAELLRKQDAQEQTSQQLGLAVQKGTEWELKYQEKEREVTQLLEKSNQVEELFMKLNSAEMREVALDEKVRELQIALTEKEREVSTSALRLKAAEDLRAQLQSAEVRGASLHEREKEASDRLRQKEMEFSAVSEKVRQMDELKMKLREENATLRAQNETLRDKEELGKLRDKELIACKDEMNKAALELNRRNDELRSLKNQVAEVQVLREEAAKMEEVKSMLVVKDLKVETLTKELGQAQLLNAQKDNEYEALVQDYDTKEEESLQQAAQLREAEAELRESVRVKSDLETASVKIEQMQKIWEEKEIVMREKANAVQTGYDRIMDEQERLRSNIASLEQQLTEALNENGQLKESLKHKDFVLCQHQEKVHGFESSEEEMRSWVHAQVKDATSRCEVSKNESARLREQTARLELDLEHKEQRIHDLAKANDELRATIEQSDDRDRPLKAKNERLQTALTSLESESDRKQALLENQVDELETKLTTAQNAVKDSNSTVREMQHSLNDVKGQMKLLGDELGELADKNRLLDQKARDADLTLRDTQAELQELRAAAELQVSEPEEEPAPLPAPVPVAASLGTSLASSPIGGDDLMEVTDDEKVPVAIPVIGIVVDETIRHGGAIKITEVKTAGLAYQHGMRAGHFLKSVDGKPVDSADRLHSFMGRCKAGQVVDVEFVKVSGKSHEAYQKAIEIKEAHLNAGSRIGSRKTSVASSAAMSNLSRTSSRTGGRRPRTVMTTSATSTPVLGVLKVPSGMHPKPL